jgi:hypothetical protein
MIEFLREVDKKYSKNNNLCKNESLQNSNWAKTVV